MTNAPHKFGTDDADFCSTKLTTFVCTADGHWKKCREQWCWKAKPENKVGFCIRPEKWCTSFITISTDRSCLHIQSHLLTSL